MSKFFEFSNIYLMFLLLLTAICITFLLFQLFGLLVLGVLKAPSQNLKNEHWSVTVGTSFVILRH